MSTLRPRFSSFVRWLPPLGWMALIFAGSSDALSASHTSRFLEPFLRWLFHGNLSAQTFDTIHYLFRKTGHLSEYAILCVLFWTALRPTETLRSTTWKWRRETLAICLAACFAASDEFHQRFVPSREASVRDVLIDTFGATLGLAVLLTVRAAYRSLRSRRPQTGTGSAPPPPG